MFGAHRDLSSHDVRAEGRLELLKSAVKTTRSRSSMLTNSMRAMSTRRPGPEAASGDLDTHDRIDEEVADSHTRSAPSASATKLGSPGVSSRLILRPCHSNGLSVVDGHLPRLLIGLVIGDCAAVRPSPAR